jgi:hypothetical protein
MAKLYRAKCRSCKAWKVHLSFNDLADRLPPDKIFVQCSGCGIFGIELLENAKELSDDGTTHDKSHIHDGS